MALPSSLQESWALLRHGVGRPFVEGCISESAHDLDSTFRSVCLEGVTSADLAAIAAAAIVIKEKVEATMAAEKVAIGGGDGLEDPEHVEFIEFFSALASWINIPRGLGGPSLEGSGVWIPFLEANYLHTYLPTYIPTYLPTE